MGFRDSLESKHWLIAAKQNINVEPSRSLSVRLPRTALPCHFKSKVRENGTQDEWSITYSQIQIYQRHNVVLRLKDTVEVIHTSSIYPWYRHSFTHRILQYIHTLKDINTQGLKHSHTETFTQTTTFLRAILPRWFDKASEWISCQTSSE